MPALLTAFLDGFMFEPMNFVYNLKYMGLGMLCIFIVIGVIALITVALEKITVRKNKENK